MIRHWFRSLNSLVWLGLLLSSAAFAEGPARPVMTEGALQRYVAQPDNSFLWSKRQTFSIDGVEVVELTLTSQTWHDITWKHQLFLLRPEKGSKTDKALLLIDSGAWQPSFEQPLDNPDRQLPRTMLLESTANVAEQNRVAPPGRTAVLIKLCKQLQTPIAILREVPFQPLFGGMVEDQLIAYTLEQYLETNDATWPLLLPMVKSTVRAMDAVQQYGQQQWQSEIKQFTLIGASKRGWTAWLTSAVDSRVAAVVPMVYDSLNLAPQMQNQLLSWGRFSEELHDYTDRGLQKHLLTGGALRAGNIVDPYAYRAVLTMPKFIVLGTNDRYWPLDSLNLYWNELPGEKHALYIPNNGHALTDAARVGGAIFAQQLATMGKLKLPELSATHEDLGTTISLKVQSDQPAKDLVAWVATAPTKDFRDARWTERPMQREGDRAQVTLEKPAAGFMAILGEGRYEAEQTPYFLSTPVKIYSAVPKP